MRLSTSRAISAAVALTATLSWACAGADGITGDHQHPMPPVTAAVSGAAASQVAGLRAVVAPLHQLSAARAAGFDAPISPCVASPAGGMGFHWANPSRIDGTVRWDEPEILVFAPQPDAADGVRLGAVEYVVPVALSPEPPVLFGETFVRGGPENSLWTLHVWIGIANPAGLFAPWNPRVTCPAG